MPTPFSRPTCGDACGRSERALAALVRSASRWARAACKTPERANLKPFRKAIEALDFTVRSGLPTFSVPTKLVGVRAYQASLRALQCAGAGFGFRLDAELLGNRVLVSWGPSRRLGFVQGKHESWLRPLISAGAEIRLIAVTGDESKGHTLGVNVALCVPASTGQPAPARPPSGQDDPSAHDAYAGHGADFEHSPGGGLEVHADRDAHQGSSTASS